MTDARFLLDPTAEQTPAARILTPRPATLAGLTIGLLDISKARGDIFLDRIEALLAKRGLAVKRYRKPSVSRPAPLEIRQAISAECDVAIEALAD